MERFPNLAELGMPNIICIGSYGLKNELLETNKRQISANTITQCKQ